MYVCVCVVCMCVCVLQTTLLRVFMFYRGIALSGFCMLFLPTSFFRFVFSRLCSHSRWPPGVCSGGGLWRPRTDPVETYLLWGLMYCMHLYLLVCVCLLCIIVWTLAFALHAFSSKLVPATAKWLTKVCVCV